MKRDMDLTRELMLRLEALPSGVSRFRADDAAIQIDGHTPAEVSYHLGLVKEAGLIPSTGSGRMGSIEFAGWTCEGHNFLDSVRSPGVWDKTNAAAAKVGGYTVDILLAMAKSCLQHKFTELLGGSH